MSPVQYGEPDATPDPAYFTVAEARAVKPLDNATKYTDDVINATREAVEEAIERACGVAFVSRDQTLTMDGPGGTDLLLPDPRPISITSCTIGGTDLDSDALAALVLYRDGRVYRSSGWPCGRGNITIVYQHGYETIPGRVKRAAILLTKRWLVDTPASDRATVLTNEDGTTQFFGGGSKQDEPFDVPEANAVVREYGMAGEVA